jgi:hypothetical protein
MKNVYTRVTTYVAYSVFVVMTTIVLIIVPSLLSGVFAKVVSKGPEVLGNIMEPFTYIASLVLAISVALVSSCVLELNETTFELSRPVNRSTFIGAKSVVAILSNCSMYL